jgi:hypothetical protein
MFAEGRENVLAVSRVLAESSGSTVLVDRQIFIIKLVD